MMHFVLKVLRIAKIKLMKKLILSPGKSATVFGEDFLYLFAFLSRSPSASSSSFRFKVLTLSVRIGMPDVHGACSMNRICFLISLHCIYPG